MSEDSTANEEALRFLRQDFPSRLAHAVRTPLGVVGGTLKELERSLAHDAPSAHAHLIQLAHRSVRQIENMATRLSLLARLEGDGFEMQRERVDPGLEVEQAIEQVRSIRKRSKVALEASVDPDLPAVSGDASLLRRAFMEIIDNALRFAKSRLAVSVRAEGDDVVVTVDDDGPGIPEEDWPDLFRPFRPRSDRSGLGIGFTIARAIVRRHGGTLGPRPPADGGCRMEIRLPALRDR